jgi:hypothetical protein
MSQEGDLLATVERFNAAWNRHDLEGALQIVTSDIVFEATGPAPDGLRHEGIEAVRAAWKPVFDDERSHFETEEIFAIGDRAVQRWRYDWGEGHVRGVDLFVIRGGRVAEKLSYVKG